MSEEAPLLLPVPGDAPGRPDVPIDNMMVDDVEAEADSRDNQAPTSLRPPPRKRRRTVISCIQCHRRKQKCDRKLPCGNCIARQKQDSCEYESGAPTAREQQTRRIAEGGAFSARFAAESGGTGSHWQGTSADAGSRSNSSSKPVNFGYSQAGASTLGFLQKLEDPRSPLSTLNPDYNIRHGDHSNTRERYKTLIRQLPARTYIEKLANLYFIEFNWHYQGLDRDVFDKQLQEWYRLPFHVLTAGGPQALDSHLRAFPALLFQVLALALLLFHPGSDPVFESLKYAGNMTFQDLALDYSESGMSILSLLGKRQMTITTVQTGFLRGSFLKYASLVTESWHAIGSAIRDGQEIGLHRDSLDPKPANDTPEAILENQWEIQRRRKLWITLVWWDLHTAVVLGRPTSIDHSQEQQPTLPIDAKMNILATTSSSPSATSSLPTPLVPRTDSDPPTPLTRLLFAIALGNQLRQIYTLEKTLGPNPHSFAVIDALHAEFLSLESQIPAWLRLENPDTRFDDLPECYWIPYARAQMPQMLAFNIMALHRPYIFTREKSRTEALKASLGMLQAQRYHFSTLRPEHYTTFTLFFGTFDAIVIVAAVFILFSREHGHGEYGEYVPEAVKQFGWAVERFRAMSGRNGLAKAALGVLRVLGVRFVRVLGLKEDVIFGEDRDGKDVEGEGQSVVVDKVPPPVTNAGLMPLPWARPSTTVGGGGQTAGSGAQVRTRGGTGSLTTTPLTLGSGAGVGAGADSLRAPSATRSGVLSSLSSTSVSVSVSPAASAGQMEASGYYSTAQQANTTGTSHGPSLSSSASPANNKSSGAASLSGHSNQTPRARAAYTAAGESWGSQNISSSSSTETSTNTNANSNDSQMVLDPGAAAAGATGGGGGGGGGGGASNWDPTWDLNIPSNFDWSSLQPIFATGDLLYNDLHPHVDSGGSGGGWAITTAAAAAATATTGHGNDDVALHVGSDGLWGGGGGGGGGGGITNPGVEAMNQTQQEGGLERSIGSGGGDRNIRRLENTSGSTEPGLAIEQGDNLSGDDTNTTNVQFGGQGPQGGGGNVNNSAINPWFIDGDFGDHSFWSLINQFGPPHPPPPPPPGGGQ